MVNGRRRTDDIPKLCISADNAATADSLRYLFVRSALALHHRDGQPGLWQASVLFCNKVLSGRQVTVSAEINCDVAHILKRTTTVGLGCEAICSDHKSSS